MNNLILCLGDWPWIFTISIAVYLAFEHWRFPDLTIEGSFTAGMTATYFAFNHESDPKIGVELPFPPVLIVVLFSLIISLLLSVLTWLMARSTPALFAGLIVTLSAYTINFFINGQETSKMVYQAFPIPRLLRYLAQSAGDLMFWLSCVLLALTIVFLIFFSQRSSYYTQITLARRTNEAAVTAAIGMSNAYLLLVAMLIYNLISFYGGVGLALLNNQSSVSFLGAISPGLFCMFIVRQVRLWSAAPVVSGAVRQPSRATRFLLQRSDSLPFILTAIGLASFLLVMVRFVVMRFYAAPGLLNAFTAFATFAVWGVFGLIAKRAGKEIRVYPNDRQIH